MASPAHILKGAAVFVGVAGGGLLLWLAQTALEHPDVQARQFGRFGESVPLWVPLILFVLLFVIAAATLFWRAGRRAEQEGLGLKTERDDEASRDGDTG